MRSLPNPGSAPLLKNDVPPARHASSSGIRSSSAAVFGFTSWFSDVDTTLRPARRNRLISSTASGAARTDAVAEVAEAVGVDRQQLVDVVGRDHAGWRRAR